MAKLVPTEILRSYSLIENLNKKTGTWQMMLARP
jgi:hypothetical protein